MRMRITLGMITFLLLTTAALAITGGNLGNQNVPGNAERFACILGTSTFSETEAEREILLSEAVTFDTLTVRVSGLQPSDGYVFFYVRKNGADTPLLVYVEPGDGDLVASRYVSGGVSFASGDRIALKVENQSTSASLRFNAFSLK